VVTLKEAWDGRVQGLAAPLAGGKELVLVPGDRGQSQDLRTQGLPAGGGGALGRPAGGDSASALPPAQDGVGEVVPRGLMAAETHHRESL